MTVVQLMDMLSRDLHSWLTSYLFWYSFVLLSQDLEKQSESQQETLRKYHQEQRALLEKVNMLQQQLSQVHTCG